MNTYTEYEKFLVIYHRIAKDLMPTDLLEAYLERNHNTYKAIAFDVRFDDDANIYVLGVYDNLRNPADRIHERYTFRDFIDLDLFTISRRED